LEERVVRRRYRRAPPPPSTHSGTDMQMRRPAHAVIQRTLEREWSPSSFLSAAHGSTPRVAQVSSPKANVRPPQSTFVGSPNKCGHNLWCLNTCAMDVHGRYVGMCKEHMARKRASQKRYLKRPAEDAGIVQPKHPKHRKSNRSA
jgi:hypothetical protein